MVHIWTITPLPFTWACLAYTFRLYDLNKRVIKLYFFLVPYKIWWDSITCSVYGVCMYDPACTVLCCKYTAATLAYTVKRPRYILI